MLGFSQEMTPKEKLKSAYLLYLFLIRYCEVRLVGKVVKIKNVGYTIAVYVFIEFHFHSHPPASTVSEKL